LNRGAYGFRQYLSNGLTALGKSEHDIDVEMQFCRSLQPGRPLEPQQIKRLARLIVEAVPDVAKGRSGILVELLRPFNEISWIQVLGELIGYVDAGRINSWGGLDPPFDSEMVEQSRQLAMKVARESGIDMSRIDICSYGTKIMEQIEQKRIQIENLGSRVFLSEISLLTTDYWFLVNRGYRTLYNLGFPILKTYWTRTTDRVQDQAERTVDILQAKGRQTLAARSAARTVSILKRDNGNVPSPRISIEQERKTVLKGLAHSATQ